MPRVEDMFPESLPTELNEELRSVRRRLTLSQRALVQAVHKFASAERVYRRERAVEYLKAKGTGPIRQAACDLACEKLMYEAHLAEGLMKAAFENVRSLRAQLSAVQTEAGNTKAELELALGAQSEI